MPATLRMPMPTMTAMTISTTLRPLLRPVGGAADAGVAGGAGVAAGETGPSAMVEPHLLQNFAPAVRGAPQELQNAISHLAGGFSLTREYIADANGTPGLKAFLCLSGNAALKRRS